MRQKTFFQQFRKKDRASGCRKDGIHYNLTGCPMIRVVGAVRGEQGLRVTSHKNIWLEFADDTNDLATQIKIWYQIAIGAIEEVKIIHADDFCRGDLLFMSNG